MKFFLMLFSMIILRCCGDSTDYSMMIQEQNDDTLLKELHGTYQINILNEKDVSSSKLNITFNDSTKQVSGFSGCNRFFGSYSLNNLALKFSDLGSTRMLCEENKNDLETNLLKAFKKTNLVIFTENGFSFYNKKKLLLSATKEVENQTTSFEYSASSRGTYKYIKITKKSISIASKRDGKPVIKQTNKENWNAILKTIKTLNIEAISTLEAPSKKFQFDGAALAHLKITKGEVTYESSPFDHGNPPKEIEALVKEILSISEKIE
ncbi:META domain-containing protein [Thalassobellus sediminis]|uniref:META domain-containing protein n=1 Tax=Thalassobellus sediminis TaxID=3367753 RepID=UPI0037AEA4AD